MKYFTDNLFAGLKSLIVTKCDQLSTYGEFIYIHPMKTKKEAGDGLKNFTEDVGMPAVIMRGSYGEKTVHTT